MPVTIQLRRDTEAKFQAQNNTLILADGEMALVTDKRYAVVGDGSSDFATLSTQQKRFYYNNDKGRQIGGSADEIQLTVVGNAQQSGSNPIFRVRSQGQTIFKVSDNGDTCLEVTGNNMNAGVCFLLRQNATSTAGHTFATRRLEFNTGTNVFGILRSGATQILVDQDRVAAGLAATETQPSLLVRGSGANQAVGIFRVEEADGTVVFKIEATTLANGSQGGSRLYIRSNFVLGVGTQIPTFKCLATPNTLYGESAVNNNTPYYALFGEGSGGAATGRLQLNCGSSANTNFIQCRKVGFSDRRFVVYNNGAVECGAIQASGNVSGAAIIHSAAARNNQSQISTTNNIASNSSMSKDEIFNYIKAMYAGTVSVGPTQGSITIGSNAAKQHFCFIVQFFPGTTIPGGGTNAELANKRVGLVSGGTVVTPSSGRFLVGFHYQVTP